VGNLQGRDYAFESLNLYFFELLYIYSNKKQVQLLENNATFESMTEAMNLNVEQLKTK